MKVLIIGSAECVMDDIKQIDIKSFDKVIAVNKAFNLFPGADIWITLHPEKLKLWSPNKPMNAKVITFNKFMNSLGSKINYEIDEEFPYLFDGQESSGSSGLYAVKYAIEVLKSNDITLAGIPMDPDMGHIDNVEKWIEGKIFWETWENMAWKLRAHNVKSLSGRTKFLLS
jgi:hypothetical protein